MSYVTSTRKTIDRLMMALGGGDGLALWLRTGGMVSAMSGTRRPRFALGRAGQPRRPPPPPCPRAVGILGIGIAAASCCNLQYAITP
jgi:hypothetical protein